MDFDDARPIWLQLVDEFRRRIASGQWLPGARVGSVRDLAVEFAVNPNTVQRALTELDRLELTITERTAGRFVAQPGPAIARNRNELAAASADAFVAALAGIGMTRHEAIDLVATRWPEAAEHTEEQG